ncbi:MAG: rRNA pseudouridine synthase [Ruminococcaceae bacterium]|nr:rRNA pseudouridine synthase [Oscillospiraceae bacterium]
MEEIKIQKYFTDCGVMSRRAAEAEIERGKVTVNGRPATLGMRIRAGVDTVEYNGRPIVPMVDERICIILNKPRGFVTTMSDEKGRPTVRMLTEGLHARVYPVGRLDMDSDGLLLLTNDGALAEKLTHPRHSIPKIYHVTVKGDVSDEILRTLNSPMTIDGYKLRPTKTRIYQKHEKNERSCVLEMTLFEGRNRQIRKMCDTVGLKITRLSRVALGYIKLGSLPEGKWRRLTKDELSYLDKSLTSSTSKQTKG